MSEFDSLVYRLKPEHYITAESPEFESSLYPRGITRDSGWSLNSPSARFDDMDRIFLSGVFMPYHVGTILRTDNVSIEHDKHNGFIITVNDEQNIVRSDLSINILYFVETEAGIDITLNEDRYSYPRGSNATTYAELFPAGESPDEQFCLYDKVVVTTDPEKVPAHGDYRKLLRNIDVGTMRREGGGSLVADFQWAQTKLLSIENFTRIGSKFSMFIPPDGRNKVLRDYTGKMTYQFSLEDEEQPVGSRLYIDKFSEGAYIHVEDADINATIEMDSDNSVPLYGGEVVFPNGVFPFHRKDTTYYTNIGNRVNGSTKINILDPSAFEGETVYLEIFGRVGPEILNELPGIADKSYYINNHLKPGEDHFNERIYNYYLFEIDVNDMPEELTSILAVNWIGLVTKIPNLKSWAGTRRRLATDEIDEISDGTARNSDKEYAILNIQW